MTLIKNKNTTAPRLCAFVAGYGETFTFTFRKWKNLVSFKTASHGQNIRLCLYVNCKVRSAYKNTKGAFGHK
jgi:hypothetical protein